MGFSKYFPYILNKYSIYTITDDAYCQKHNHDKFRIKFCNEHTKAILELNGDSSHVWLYDTLLWVDNY